MSSAHFLPWFAAVTCLELAAVFFLLSRQAGAAKSNAVFSFLCLCFAAVIWSVERLVHAESAASGLWVYRIQLASGMFAAAAAIHFVRSITQAAPASARFAPPLRFPLPRAVPRLYALAALLALFAWHPLVLHLPPAHTRVTDYDDAMAGPLFPLYCLLIFGGVAYACGLIAAAWKRERHDSRLYAEPAQAGYRAFAGQMQWLLLSFGLLLLASVLEFGQAMDWGGDEYGFLIFPRAPAMLFFCLTTAWNLGRQMLASERRKTQVEAIAQTRLTAARHTQHQIKNALAQIERPLHNVLEQTPAHPPQSAPREAVPRQIVQNEADDKTCRDEAVQGAARGVVQDGVQQEAANRRRVARAIASIQELHHTLDVALNLARVEVGEPLNLGAKTSIMLADWVEAQCRRRLELDDAASLAPENAVSPALEDYASPANSVASAAAARLLRLDFHADLPANAVFIYEDALREVLAVLLDNACKYAPRGSLLTVRVGSEADRLCFCLSDQGRGVRPEDRERIFDLYRGGQASGEHIAGTGIGLTLAKRYVEAQGGRIRVESDGEGKGSAFYFHLPLELDTPACM